MCAHWQLGCLGRLGIRRHAEELHADGQRDHTLRNRRRGWGGTLNNCIVYYNTEKERERGRRRRASNWAWLNRYANAALGAGSRRQISFAKPARRFAQEGLALARALVAGGIELLHRVRSRLRDLVLKSARTGTQKSRRTTWE